MWTRSILKDAAKEHLRASYWVALGVVAIVGFLGGGSRMFTWQFNANDFRMDRYDWDKFASGDWQSFFGQLNNDMFRRMFTVGLLAGLFAVLVSIAYNIFVSPLVQVGGNRWFSRNREAAARPLVGQVFSLFRSGSYAKTVLAMLWMNLFLFFWGLLTLIPVAVGWILSRQEIISLRQWLQSGGDFSETLFNRLAAIAPVFALAVSLSALFAIPLYIKMYSYRLTPWILADNPAIGMRRALRLSIELTRGQKWQIFVLDLSFIGWFLLGMLACGVGVFFVMPYYQAVQAELYSVLRQNGVDSGQCSMEELGFTKVA
jgi:uncharacterized membrane protein